MNLFRRTRLPAPPPAEPMPPRPPECRPAAPQIAWMGYGPVNARFDPCGAGPLEDRSEEEAAP